MCLQENRICFNLIYRYLETIRQNDGQNADDGAVNAKPNQLTFFHEIYHPFAGEAAADEGSDETHHQSGSRG